MNNELILYTTLGCHLCEQAEEIISPLLVNALYHLKKVDIAESEDLVERYGIKIPVLKNQQTQNELCWPFSEKEVAQLLI